MVSDTLLIRHLPVSLAPEEVKDFLKHIGAIQVSIHESKIRKYNYAFAKFQNELVAGEVLGRIHQKEVLDSRLIVEFAGNGCVTRQENEDKVENIVQEENKKTKLRQVFLRNLNNWTVGLNLTLPPPYHLKYRYPFPDPRAILNIANTLTCNLKFFTQVMHLMNKMNLPCPFESYFPQDENDVFDSFLMFVFETVKSKNHVEKTEQDTNDSSEKESELESENDDPSAKYPKNAVPVKRKSSSVEIFAKKRRLLVSKIPNASKINKTQIGDVFEQVERDNCAKKIEVKIKTNSAAICHSSEIGLLDKQYEEPKSQDTTDLTHSAENIQVPPTQKVDETMSHECISAEELASNKISEKDRQVLPFFKNYHPGTPSCRLYLKNLSKQVVASDLNYIFARYSTRNVCEQTMFNIRLMQEGRMKGQAFVTLPTVELAELALKETNGYIVKGKPMVVQFAKTPLMKTDVVDSSK